MSLKLIDNFNGYIKFFSRTYVTKSKNTQRFRDAELSNRRLIMAIDHDPLCIIREAGPYILKYADVIHNGEWDKIIDADFSGESKDEKVSNEISFIQKLFKECSEREKNVLGDKLQSLLSDYCEYMILSRKT